MKINYLFKRTNRVMTFFIYTDIFTNLYNFINLKTYRYYGGRGFGSICLTVEVVDSNRTQTRET